MHAQTISTTAQANEATPIAALKAKRSATAKILPGETPVQAAIRAAEHQRWQVMEPAGKAHTAAEVAEADAKDIVAAIAFPESLVVKVAREITEEPNTWPLALVFSHPDGREDRRDVPCDRVERLESRDTVIAHFGDEHPDLQDRLADFDAWAEAVTPARQRLEMATAEEEKANLAYQRSYTVNDRLCRAILRAPAQPGEAVQQVEAYTRLLSSSGRDITPEQITFDEDLVPLVKFMHAALKQSDIPPPSPMLDALTKRNQVVDELNGDNDLSDEEFDRQHELGWRLNNQILDDNSFTPDSALAKLRLILRADVVESLQFNEPSIHDAFRTAISVIEREHPSLSREDAALDLADRASTWIDDFIAAGGSLIREDGGDGPDRIAFYRMTRDIPASQLTRSTALLEHYESGPASFAKAVDRIALDRMLHDGTGVLATKIAADPVAIAAE